MRRSIKLIALAITLGLFITLNIIWIVIDIQTGGITASFDNVYYFIAFFIILGSMMVLVIYYISKTRQKSKIRF